MRHSRLRSLYVPAIAALLLAPLPARAQLIDTGTPPTAPNWPIFPFGRGTDVQYVSFGQSFTVAPSTPTRLDEFQFWLRDNAITGSTPYYAYVFGWDAATRRTTGSYLFRSAAQNYTGAAVPTPVSFVTGGLNLTAGQTYLAVLSTTEFPDAPVGLRPGLVMSTAWPNDGYPGGTAYVRFSPVSAGLGGLTSDPWAFAGGVTNGQDFAFRATFSSAATPPTTTIPEPASILLTATGVLGLGLIARRRRAR